MSHAHSDTCCDSDSCCGGSGACCKEWSAPRLGKVEAVENLKTLSLPDLVRRYRKGVENFDRRIFDLSEEQLDQAFLPDAGVGRWPIRVVLGHVADAELVAVHRMRRIVAEERPMLCEWDENAFVDRNVYGVGLGPSGGGAIGAFVAATHVMRQWTSMWFSGLSDADMARVGLHPSRGEQSVKDIITLYTWHLEHHAAFVNEKVVRFLGEAPAEEPKQGGCGSGCGCKN